MFCSFTAVGSKKTDWNKYNSFAIAISSHGLEIEKKENGNTVKHHAILMFDDVTFDTKDVLGYFSDKECTGLIDKAKIFFIQVWISQIVGQSVYTCMQILINVGNF